MLKLALTLRWIAALVFCLLLAVGFALMAQWQIGRSFVDAPANNTWLAVTTTDLTQVAVPNSPFTFNEIPTSGDKPFLTQVTTSLTVDPSKAVLVSNRIQVNGDKGYWLVVPAQTDAARLFVVAGFINEERNAASLLSEVKQLTILQALVPVTGRYLPSEAPLQSVGGDVFDSLSIAQWINLNSFDSEQVYTGFMVLTENNLFSSVDGVEMVTIGMPKSDSQVNWLSAFYAIEWTVFAGFAVFMWWRLLADSYKKQQAALLAE
ncbi:MAG: hypothetical protein NTW23_04840 [Rhodoluna sp.]|nr:hypothetical protein [Rhodoluna sp.]